MKCPFKNVNKSTYVGIFLQKLCNTSTEKPYIIIEKN